MRGRWKTENNYRNITEGLRREIRKIIYMIYLTGSHKGKERESYVRRI